MLKHITIKNLRSIKSKKIEIAPITVFYGENGSGKSTIMHSLAILKNIVLNPNQAVENFFNLGFANFGGFKQIVFDHKSDENIELEIGCQKDSALITFSVKLYKKDGTFQITVVIPDEKRPDKKLEISFIMDVSFPYYSNKEETKDFHFVESGKSCTISWNGILAKVSDIKDSMKIAKVSDSIKNTDELVSLFNCHIELLKTSDYVHLKRGFSKAQYGTITLSQSIVTEEEMATFLANDPYLDSNISHSLETIFDKDFRIKMTPGSSVFSINTTDNKTGLSTELVNDGFGINQVVYLLAKCLKTDTSVVCIEEPEIHLHPKALRKLANELIRISIDLNKTILVSTHSEHFVLALLSAVSRKEIKSDDIACYLFSKDKKKSKIERQTINSDGQIKGGLASFMEGELEDLKDMFAVSKKNKKNEGRGVIK